MRNEEGKETTALTRGVPFLRSRWTSSRWPRRLTRFAVDAARWRGRVTLLVPSSGPFLSSSGRTARMRPVDRPSLSEAARAAEPELVLRLLPDTQQQEAPRQHPVVVPVAVEEWLWAGVTLCCGELTRWVHGARATRKACPRSARSASAAPSHSPRESRATMAPPHWVPPAPLPRRPRCVVEWRVSSAHHPRRLRPRRRRRDRLEDRPALRGAGWACLRSWGQAPGWWLSRR